MMDRNMMLVEELEKEEICNQRGKEGGSGRGGGREGEGSTSVSTASNMRLRGCVFLMTAQLERREN